MEKPRKKKKAKTGRPLEKIPMKTLVKRVLKELDQKKVIPVPAEANLKRKKS